MDLIRVWKEVDIKDIENHLIIVDDLHGFCPKCKSSAIKYGEMQKCSSCGQEFKYAGVRLDGNLKAAILSKLSKQQPNLTIIDYNDYKHILDKQKANSLFSISGKDE